ncbi:hypothetical protein QP561_06980 [Veillonella nakazawae]|nr:hypothetical protein [Veillonella nakazawae]MDK7739990.1 hypothetical protein [Veillonella nakazawae]
MINYEHALKLQQLQIALTIVIGNDIIIPIVEQRETVLAATMIYGFIWRYKNAGVKVDLGSMCDAEILENNKLEEYIEDTRAYVKSELHKLIDKEVKSNAM